MVAYEDKTIFPSIQFYGDTESNMILHEVENWKSFNLKNISWIQFMHWYDSSSYNKDWFYDTIEKKKSGARMKYSAMSDKLAFEIEIICEINSLHSVCVEMTEF